VERFLDSSTRLPGRLLRSARQRPSNDTTSLDITASRSLNETRRFNVQVACFLSFKRLRWLARNSFRQCALYETVSSPPTSSRDRARAAGRARGYGQEDGQRAASQLLRSLPTQRGGDVIEVVGEQRGVGVKGHLGGLMAQHPLDHFDVGTSADRERRRGVAEIVWCDSTEACVGRHGPLNRLREPALAGVSGAKKAADR
jgi:hypothetical protein